MDLIFLFSIIVLATLGFFRGFFKEILGLTSFVASICLSIALNKFVVKKTLFMIEEPIIASTTAYILSFLIILFFFTIFNFLIIKIFKLSNPSILVKILGGFVGIFKAYFFCLLIYCVIYSFALVTKNNEEQENENTIKKMEQNMPKFFTESKTFPYFIVSIDKIDKIAKAFASKNSKNSKKELSLQKNQSIDKNLEAKNQTKIDEESKNKSEDSADEKEKSENQNNSKQDESDENNKIFSQNISQIQNDSFENMNQRKILEE